MASHHMCIECFLSLKRICIFFEKRFVGYLAKWFSLKKQSKIELEKVMQVVYAADVVSVQRGIYFRSNCFKNQSLSARGLVF